jgi:hypothetical protein
MESKKIKNIKVIANLYKISNLLAPQILQRTILKNKGWNLNCIDRSVFLILEEIWLKSYHDVRGIVSIWETPK